MLLLLLLLVLPPVLLLLVNRWVAGAGGDAQAEANKARLRRPCICVTTFNMISHKGKRSEYGEEVRYIGMK